MVSFAILWDIIKVALLPVVGVLCSMIYQKIKSIESNIDKLKDESQEQRENLIKLEGRAVTKEELQKLMSEFEIRIDKSINQNLKPLEILIKEAMKRKQDE